MAGRSGACSQPPVCRRGDAIGALVDALPDTVADWAAAKTTAAWAVEIGMAEPLQLEDRPMGVRR